MWRFMWPGKVLNRVDSDGVVEQQHEVDNAEAGDWLTDDPTVTGVVNIEPTSDENTSSERVFVTANPMQDDNARLIASLNRAKRVFVQLGVGNTLYSPVSLEMALGLLSEGCTGETKEQIMQFLDLDEYKPVAQGVFDGIGDKGVSNSFETHLDLANSVWVDEDFTFKQDYRGVASDSYHALAQALDYSQAETSAKEVNVWCRQNTGGIIPFIVRPEYIKKGMGVILCNALYFESSWKTPWFVHPGEFTNSDGSVVRLSGMLYGAENVYYETDNAVAFSKPYVDGRTFLGILPNDGVSLADINFDALISSVSYQYTVNVSMPKFVYDSTCRNLKFILRHLGVRAPFNFSVATLDDMATGKIEQRLFVSDVIQKCRIELDENGTKAAADTSFEAFGSYCAQDGVDLQTKSVHLVRPFYFAILDDNTGQVLFLGQVDTMSGIPCK